MWCLCDIWSWACSEPLDCKSDAVLFVPSGHYITLVDSEPSYTSHVSCDLVAVAVERDRSVHLQRQPRRPEGLPPERSEHVRRCRVPVRTAGNSTQTVHHQVRRQVSQPLAPRPAGAGTVCGRDESAVQTSKCCSCCCHCRCWVWLWGCLHLTSGMSFLVKVCLTV